MPSQAIPLLLSLVFILFLGAIGLKGFLKLQSKMPRTRFPTVSWGWTEALFGGMLILMIGSLVVGWALTLERFEGDKVPALAAQALWGLAVVLILYLLLSRFPGFDRDQLGCRLARGGDSVLLGFTGYLAFLPVYLVVLYANLGLHGLLGWDVDLQAPVHALAREEDPLALAVLALSASIVIPVGEEFFFRGVLYGLLRKHLRRWSAILASGLIFALFHFGSPFLPILALGILLGALYDRSGSLLTPLTIHVLHNSVTILYILLIPTAIEARTVAP